MAEVTAEHFLGGAGVGYRKVLGATAQLFTVPGNCDTLVLTGDGSFSAAPNKPWSLADGAAVTPITDDGRFLSTTASATPYQIIIPRPPTVGSLDSWGVVAWSSGTPTVQPLAVREFVRTR